MKIRLASGFSRNCVLISFSERVAARMASGWNARLFFCARRKIRIRLTGSCLKTSGAARLMRLLSTMKSSLSGTRRCFMPGRNRAIMRLKHRRGLGLLVFQLGAQDRGEIADVLGDQEVVLHEAFDVLHAGMRGVSQPHRDLALHVERHPLLGAAADKMQVAAHRPQKILAAAEGAVFLRVEHAALDQFVGGADAIDVFRDPEQRVQVAQAALAVLDIGLDQIARLSGAAQALLALGQFRGDEFGRGALHDLLVEALDQFVVQRLVAGQEPGFQDRGADGHVAARLADRFVDRPRGVADLQPHVPQAIQDGFRDLLAPRGLLVGQDEQQIDVGFRRHQPAAIAAGGDHRHPFGAGRNRRAIQMAGRSGEQDADDFVLDETQPFGAAPAVAVLQQHLLGDRRAPVMNSALSNWARWVRKTSSCPACFAASASTAAVILAVSKRSSASGRACVTTLSMKYRDIGRRGRCHGSLWGGSRTVLFFTGFKQSGSRGCSAARSRRRPRSDFHEIRWLPDSRAIAC